MSIKKHIPNAITCGNLFCGCLALVKAFEGDLIWAAYLVGIALVLDFFDGFMARLLKVSSNIGKDLDSLADMVTFGVVPGIMMFKILQFYILSEFGFKDETQYLVTHSDNHWNYVPYFGLIIPVFSCIRLAKFNNDLRQSHSFIGLPTPANAMIIGSVPLIFNIDRSFMFERHKLVFESLFLNPFFLLPCIFVLSFLLVSEIPLFALKFKNFSWADNKLTYLFLTASIVLLLVLKFIAIPLIIFLYILISIVNNIFLKNKV